MKRAHRCFIKVNKELEKFNTRLDRNLMNPNHVLIKTIKIKNLRDGKNAKTLFAPYCPFCGEKLEEV